MAHNFKFLLIASLLFPLIITSALANHPAKSHKHPSANIVTNQKEENISPNPNEAILVVHGLVCSFCAYGIQKKLSKLDFVDTTKFNKKGSKVNIETQRVTVAIKPGSKANIDVIFKEIKSGGYKPIRAYVADGKGEVKIIDPK